jgi:hypothetical protein
MLMVFNKRELGKTLGPKTKKKNYKTETFKIYNLLSYFSDAFIKKDEAKAFNAYMGEQNCIQSFGWKS